MNTASKGNLTTIYDQHLPGNAANYTALNPVSSVERSAEVFGDLPAVVPVRDVMTGTACVTV